MLGSVFVRPIKFNQIGCGAVTEMGRRSKSGCDVKGGGLAATEAQDGLVIVRGI